MGDSNGSDPREELLRLREENLRLREESLSNREAGSGDANGQPGQVFNIKQVNESCVSGCVGLVVLIVVLAAFLGKCSG